MAVTSVWFGRAWEGRGEKEKESGRDLKKRNVWVFSDDVMELAENTSLLLECKQ